MGSMIKRLFLLLFTCFALSLFASGSVLSQSDSVVDVPDGDVDGLIAALSGAAMRPGGSFTINLAAEGDYALSSADFHLFAPTALPIIPSDVSVTINGSSAVIRALGEGYRLFGVDGGSLTLSNLTLRDATLYGNGGAALVNVGGIVTLNNVRLEGNRVTIDMSFGSGIGGALYSFFGQTTINNSAFIGNAAILDGGALYSWDSAITVTATRFEGNQAGRFGGAVALRNERAFALFSGADNRYISNEALQAGGAFYVESGSLIERGALIENNQSDGPGGVLFSSPSGDPVERSAPMIQINNSRIIDNTSPLVAAYALDASVNLDGNWWGTPDGAAPTELVGSGISAASPLSVANPLSSP
jgi:hypothetical protein